MKASAISCRGQIKANKVVDSKFHSTTPKLSASPRQAYPANYLANYPANYLANYLATRNFGRPAFSDLFSTSSDLYSLRD
jgi:hypothetical protein